MTIDQSHLSLETVFPFPLKKTGNTSGGEYHAPCPFCGGKDRFYVHPAKQLWTCRQCNRGGDYIAFIKEHDNVSHVEACERLGLTPETPDAPHHSTPPKKTINLQAAPLPTNNSGTIQVQSTKQAYDGLVDYAYTHGVTSDVLEKAGWKETTRDGRPALSFPVNGGEWTRYRFIDGDSDKRTYTNEPGFQKCWYGLDRALIIASEEDKPLVYVNGEISVIAGQDKRIPAVSLAGGGEQKIPDDLLAELNGKYTGALVIALDCDDAGRAAAEKVRAQWQDSVIVNLGLSDGGDLADLIYIRPSTAPQVLWQAVEAAKLTPRPGEIVSSYTANEHYKLRLSPRHRIAGVPILMPFRSLHQFGGFAEVMMPGKVVLIPGATGTGKTTLLETLADGLNMDGHSGLWYGSEWTPAEYAAKRVQRHGGVSRSRMNRYELYKSEVARGVAKPLGEPLTPEEIKRSQQAADTIAGWPGVLEYLPPAINFTDTLEAMRDKLTYYRNQGKMMTFCVFDYVQLLRAGNIAIDGDNRHEVALELIKQFAEVNNIVAVAASQVLKSATRDAKSSNDLITDDDMLYVRSDKSNLCITTNVVYTTKPALDGIGEDIRKKTNRGKLNVVKNSDGETGHVQCMIDWPGGRWLPDTSWESSGYNKRGIYTGGRT